MPALEQVCKRLFSNQSFVSKRLVAACPWRCQPPIFQRPLRDRPDPDLVRPAWPLPGVRLIGYLLMPIILFTGLAAVVKFSATFSGR
jgi:hypothetical protein